MTGAPKPLLDTPAELIPLHELSPPLATSNKPPSMRGLSDDDDLEQLEEPPVLTRWQRFVAGPRFPANDPAPRIGWLGRLESIPDWFNTKFTHVQKVALLICYLVFWGGLVYQLMIPYLIIPPYVTSEEQLPVITLGCEYSGLWAGKNQRCGLNGTRCPEVHDLESDFIIRCPALCHLAKQYSLMPIGDQRIRYRPFVVGGGDDVTVKVDDENQLTNPYRGDSIPCVAAAHAGLTSPLRGGCVRVSFKLGPQMGFSSARGHQGTGELIAFDSYFPSSFYFKRMGDAKVAYANDPRFSILAVNILFGIPIVVLGLAAVVFWTMSTVSFWLILFSEDPITDINPSNPEYFGKMVSKGCERYLPTCFILFVLYKYSVGITLGKPADGPSISLMSRLLLWYPAFWIGALNNITFDALPIDRLSVDAITAQPGGVLSVMFLLVFGLIGGGFQAYRIWKTGKFWTYLKFYLLLLAFLLVLVAIPGVKFHLHHYILGILLLPACATRNRTGLFFSGLLLGMFISGASRWGLDLILETAAQWAREDPIGLIIPPIITNYTDGYLHWDGPTNQFSPLAVGNVRSFEGVSLLINDIEMWRGNHTLAVELAPLLPRLVRDANEALPIYLRMARFDLSLPLFLDYSNAAVLQWPSGNLTVPVPGLT